LVLTAQSVEKRGCAADARLTLREGIGCAGRRNGERDAGDGAKRKLTEVERVRLKKEEKARKDSEGIMFSAGKGSKVREEMIRARMREQEVVSTSPMRARAAEKQRKEKVEAAKREKKQQGQPQLNPKP
jgi:G:T/U-mismatch repair DNA glycosylase